jgi:hypothetical protein
MANHMKRHTAPIIAAILLLLPIYMGSYFAVAPRSAFLPASPIYRSIGAIYWPLEQIDRRLRPESWYLMEDGDL